MKNTHGGVLFLTSNTEAEACNFSKSNTSPWMAIIQMVSKRAKYLLSSFNCKNVYAFTFYYHFVNLMSDYSFAEKLIA